MGLQGALQGLTREVGKRQSAKEDMNTLMSALNLKEQKDAKEQQAEAVYQDTLARVSDQANELLENDRLAITSKAHQLQTRLAEKVKAYGGSKAEFMKKGGISELAKYERDLVKSTEFTKFKKNKKNMEHILMIKDAGKGHLINKRDLDNLEYYNVNGEGDITYSGLLNDITVDPTAFEFGHSITAKEVLAQGPDTKLRIAANFEADTGQEWNGSDAILEEYVKKKGYGGVGKNYQIISDRNAQERFEKQFSETVRMNNHRISMDNINKILKANEQIQKDLKAKYKQYVKDNTVSLTGSLGIVMGKANGMSISQMEDPEANPFLKSTFAQVFGKKRNVNVSSTPEHPFTKEAISFTHRLTLPSLLYKGGSKLAGNYDETIGRLESFKLTGSTKIFLGSEERVAKHYLGQHVQQNGNGTYSINPTSIPRTFDASGRSMSGRTLRGWDDKNYRVTDIVTGFVMQGENIPDQIVVDVVDANGNTLENKTEEIRGKNNKGTSRGAMFVRYHDKDNPNHDFYHEVPVAALQQLSEFQEASGAIDKVSDIMDEQIFYRDLQAQTVDEITGSTKNKKAFDENVKIKNEAITKKNKETKKEYDKNAKEKSYYLVSKYSQTKPFQSNTYKDLIQKYQKNGLDRNNLIKSFYITMASNDDNINSLTNNIENNTFVNAFANYDLLEPMMNTKVSNQDIIDLFFKEDSKNDRGEEDYFNKKLWLENYENLYKKNYKNLKK